MVIKERVLQVLDYKGFSKETFFTKIGMTSANFRGNARKTPLNSTAIENVLSEIPEINEIWLLTGKGEMLKTTQSSASTNTPSDPTVDRLLSIIESQQRMHENLSETIRSLTKNKEL